MKILRAGQAAVVYDNGKDVESETELTEAEWTADDSKALRGVLDRCLTQLARNMAVDLIQPATNIRRDPRLPDRVPNSASCDDKPGEWTARSAAIASTTAVPAGTSQTTAEDGTTVLERHVASGQEVRVNHHARWDPNCNASTTPRVSVTLPSQHGRVNTFDAKGGGRRGLVWQRCLRWSRYARHVGKVLGTERI